MDAEDKKVYSAEEIFSEDNPTMLLVGIAARQDNKEASMRTFVSFLVLLVAVTAGGGSGVFAADSAESDAPQWREQQQDAASFAADWLTDLDNGQYADAAAVYTVDGNRAELQKRLQSMRGDVGALSSRDYGGAHVFAVATDDSEWKVRVIYLTEFSRKKVRETVDVLLWHTSPVVLAYTMEEQ